MMKSHYDGKTAGNKIETGDGVGNAGDNPFNHFYTVKLNNLLLLRFETSHLCDATCGLVSYVD